MTRIAVNYAGMAAAHTDLVGSWTRIEQHLADLEVAVAGMSSMRAESLQAYLTLKARWDAAAAERQHVLRALADFVEGALTQYQQADSRIAAMFLG
ncbi:hypothetical protein D1871_04205 [Nakamurella silvestris]|nr:hypothetical protein D1871_04205 [Nakamurella silvestris]